MKKILKFIVISLPMVVITFAIITYGATWSRSTKTPSTISITYTVGNSDISGSILGENNQVVERGKAGKLVTAKPNDKYLFSHWLEDNSTLEYRIDSSNVDITFTAVFVEKEYNIIHYTVKLLNEEEGKSLGGEIIGNTNQHVEKGKNGSIVTAKEHIGYKFVSWSDGNTKKSRIDKKINKNLEIQALFTIDLVILNYSTEIGGRLLGAASQKIQKSASGSTITAVAINSYYQFAGWSDGITTAERTDKNVLKDINVTAQFTAPSIIKKYELESLRYTYRYNFDNYNSDTLGLYKLYISATKIIYEVETQNNIEANPHIKHKIIKSKYIPEFIILTTPPWSELELYDLGADFAKESILKHNINLDTILTGQDVIKPYHSDFESFNNDQFAKFLEYNVEVEIPGTKPDTLVNGYYFKLNNQN